uniref:BRCT domain-containing protein n=1 Tax=Peronospora matthiolae TaxID=2874970 RepID=A0AAV1TL56_9STRA
MSLSAAAAANPHHTLQAAPPQASPALPSSCTAAARPRRRRRSSHGPLQGVVAIVDVRVGADAQIDCSDVVARKLRELGACTVKRFTPKLTHVVLSHLTPVWKAKIVKWQTGGGSGASAVAAAGVSRGTRYELHIVSQLWVNACYVSKQKRDERSFFPVRQQQHVVMDRQGTSGAAATLLIGREAGPQQQKQRRRGRPSLGQNETLKLGKGRNVVVLPLQDNEEREKASGNGGEKKGLDYVAVDLLTPSPVGRSKVNKTLQRGKRKMRAHSMEPLASDAILKLLGDKESVAGGEEIISTPVKQMIRSRCKTSSVKRRKTLNGPPTQQYEDDVTASQAHGIEAESAIEIDKKSGMVEESNLDGVVVPDCQASLCLSGASSALTPDGKELGAGSTPGDSSKSPKRTTARELRRRNRTSLSYGSGLTLKTGIWSCAACGCSNPRTHRCCTDCQGLKGVAKSTSVGSIDPVSPVEIASTMADVPKAHLATSTSTLANVTDAPPVTPSTPATPVSTTPNLTEAIRLSTFAIKLKRSSSCLSVPGRNSWSLTRPTASSAAKARTPSPSASKVPRAVLRSSAYGTGTCGGTLSPATRVSTSKHTNRRALVANASISTVARVQHSVAEKALLTTGAMKLMQGSAKKRSRPPFSSNLLTTPVVKKARRNINTEDLTMDKHLATPGSVSGFLKKHRDVNLAPISMAMSFSSTINSQRPARSVIGITGVSAELRGVLECAIHAIDANMTNDTGYRKARMVKSVDYAAGVTHLIVGKGAKRTIKVLFAIARGAWIVSEDWAFSSLEQERWLPEEDFELTMFANKYSREHPESRQKFKGMKFFVGPNVEPSREVLQSLIQVAGGEICNQISVADVCICGDASLFRRARRTGIQAVTSKWVFDSIAAMKLEDEAKYNFTVPMDVLAKTPLKSRQDVASGLEAHSTVPE